MKSWSMAFVLLCSHAASASANDGLLDITLEATLGRDLGQPVGSLFEARDDDGHVLFGAAVPDAFSTYVRDNNRVMTFYAKGLGVTPTLSPIGKPFDSDHNGVRLLVDGPDLLAMYREFNPIAVKRLDEKGEWTDTGDRWAPYEGLGGIQVVNNKRLLFSRRTIVYDGREIFRSEHSGLSYYAGGRLFIAQSAPKRLLVADWNPEVDAPVTEELCRSFFMDGDPFVFGSWRDHVLLATNIGNVYVYRNGNLDTLRRSDGQSWQAYSLTMLYDTLLIGHYPSGALYTYNGDGLAPFKPDLPVLEGAAKDSREAQTLAMYAGELYVGVWPWGEVWRFDPDPRSWHFVCRVFDQPAVTSDVLEPYAREMRDTEDVYNYWGQRIMNLTSHDDALYIGTMNKQGKPFIAERHAFLSPLAVSQYGQTYRFDGGAQIAAQFKWKERTSFRFVCDGIRMSMYQDDVLLGATELTGNLASRRVKTMTYGNGICGDFAGTLRLRE